MFPAHAGVIPPDMAVASACQGNGGRAVAGVIDSWVPPSGHPRPGTGSAPLWAGTNDAEAAANTAPTMRAVGGAQPGTTVHTGLMATRGPAGLKTASLSTRSSRGSAP